MSTKSGGQIYHLKVADVLVIHSEAISQFGGSAGIREMALLESAVAAPQASFGGESVYNDLIEVAAAYLFFICRNHPFVDGNKRTALVVSFGFLDVNGFEVMASPEDAYLTILSLAAGELTEEQLEQWFEKNTEQR